MRTRAVLFDLDGTLLDSLADIGESMNFALESMGLPQHPLGNYRGFVGDGMTLLARRALPPDRRGEEDVAACVAAMRRAYSGRATALTAAYDGIPDLLDALAGQGTAMAVLSNKPHDMTCRLVEELLARWRFHPVFGERPGVPRKPDPAGALEVAGLLGLVPGEILYVGDTPTDMETAIAADMRPVGAAWGFRGETELREAGATVVARHPREVLRHLSK